MIERVANALRAERQQHGTAILLVEQNVEFALNLADHYVVLKRGEVVAAGSTEDRDALATIEAQLSI